MDTGVCWEGVSVEVEELLGPLARALQNAGTAYSVRGVRRGRSTECHHM